MNFCSGEESPSKIDCSRLASVAWPSFAEVHATCTSTVCQNSWRIGTSYLAKLVPK